MRATPYIRSASKTDLKVGPWQSGKRLPKTAIRTKRPYPVTGKWTWRLISFTCGGEPYKVLLKHRKERQDFMAMLVHDGVEATVLCRVEHHGSHPGWHVHYQPNSPFVAGVVRTPNEKRKDCGQGSSFGTKVLSEFDTWAMTVASQLFGLTSESEDDLGLFS